MRPEDEPRDDEPTDDEPGDDEAPPDDHAGEHEAPPPATYAGRKRAEGDPTGAAGEGEENLREGFTDEFDEIERDLDAELAGLDVAPAAAEPEAKTEPEAAAEPESDAEPEAEEESDDEEPDLDEQEPDEADLDDEDLDDEDLDDEDFDELDDDDGYDDADDLEPESTEQSQLPSDATVEAETVALADKAEAEEAALAGLRARAAKKDPTSVVRVTEPAPDASKPPPAVVPPPAAAADEGDEGGNGKPPHAKRLWARFLTASVVIVASVAAATSISLLVYLTDIANGLNDNDKLASLHDQLVEADGGAPQTILIIGSDKRLDTKGDPGRSDTTILLRVDPEKDAIALLSIPRDLKVNIPGYGVGKFNEAYTYGGPEKTLKVVQQLAPDLDINHVVNINFTGFADAVNAIGCVYVDVDRRYYIPPETGTAEINIEAGYQRMCGYNALQYVRFRHFDNDLVRAARQQDFLREARQKLPPQKLIEDRNELLDIFTEYTTSDISDAVQLLELLKTFLGVRSAPVREVHFPAQLGTTYVTASDNAIQEAVDQFLNTEGTPGERPAGQSPPGEQPDQPSNADQQGGNDGNGGNGGGDQSKPDENKPDDHFEGPAMQDSAKEGQTYAHQVSVKRKKDGDPMITFPIYYPTRLVPGSYIARDSRAFVIDGPDKDVYYGYKMVVDVPGDTFGHGLTDEYYGVSGTDWVDAPILANPGETRTIDGREYRLFYDGDRLRLVGWVTDKGAYWVNNTLLQSLDEGQMLSIATSMREYEGK